MGYALDLSDPVSLNEKINWLILNDRTPLHTLCADKYRVRAHVAKKVGKQYLVPLVFHAEDPSELTKEILPDYPVIVKANHNSAGYTIIRDKNTVDWKQLRAKFKKLLKINYYKASKQWQYKNIVPKIIVEKLLMDEHGEVPPDYKFHCFNGIVRMLQVDINRNKPDQSRNWFNRDWEREPYTWPVKRKYGEGNADPLPVDPPKPKSYELMVELSEILASDFDYVRVDWYNMEGTLYFGELTFHHSGGRCPILPYEWDVKLGQELNLVKSKSQSISKE